MDMREGRLLWQPPVVLQDTRNAAFPYTFNTVAVYHVPFWGILLIQRAPRISSVVGRDLQ